MSTFWLDDIPAHEAGLPPCGDSPSRDYPTGCTREVGHPGWHGHPNWSGRVEVTARISPAWTSLEIDTRNSHQGTSATVRNRQQGLDLIEFLRASLDETFPA